MAHRTLDSIIADAHAGTGLNRSLSTMSLVLLGVGGVIGAGIFVLTGQAAANYAGPAIVLSFILSAIGCVFAALCYAELAAMIPASGSAYTYAYATMGRTVAWIIGWDLVLEYLFSASTVAVGWSGYVTSFLVDLGIPVPAIFVGAPFSFDHINGWTRTGSLINLPAVAIVTLCTIILFRGLRESTLFNNIVVLLKVAVIVTFIIAGAAYVNPANLTPFIPENTGVFGHYGWSGVFRGAGVIFFAYIGFDCLSTLGQETKDPQKSLPIGIIGSLAVCTVLYILVAIVMTGIVPYKLLNDPAPIAVAVNAAGPGLEWLRPLIKLGAIAGLSSVVLVMLMGQPRIFFAMSRDGLLPPIFSRVHSKFQTPHFSTVITGIVAGICAGLLPIGILGELVSIGTLLAFVIVCGGVLVLRKTDPTRHRPFRVRFVPLVPILGILVSLAQMLSLPLDTWIRLAVWLAIGLVIYYGYSVKHANSR